ncbi:hypothetical protein H9W91_01135 [Streptomyces alfalfae]|nr:hypothetical protein H9W91_01135 [Streptomyces alfalfae]
MAGCGSDLYEHRGGHHGGHGYVFVLFVRRVSAGIVTREAGRTDRQRRIVDAIRASISERGHPPSVRELGQATGLASTSSFAHQSAASGPASSTMNSASRPAVAVGT